MRRIFYLLLIAATALFVSGCVHEDEIPKDGKLPWSRPAAWEGQTLGIPM